MRLSKALCIFLASGLLATAVEAGPKAGKDQGADHGHTNCPPGLAKKNPPCVPPGLANRDDAEHRDDENEDHDPFFVRTYTVGHALPDAYVILFDPKLFPDWHHAAYVRSGDFFYLIDRQTGKILLNSGPVKDWSWGWSDVDFAHCPPGLAKKNPPCVPPGQVKTGGPIDPWHKGDHIPAGYTTILVPQGPDGADNALYVRLGDKIYRVDRQNAEVLNLIGLISDFVH